MLIVKRELERERTGHGESVAAMQSEYANERRQVETLNRKVSPRVSGRLLTLLPFS